MKRIAEDEASPPAAAPLLPRVCWWLGMACAAGLVSLVFLAPLIDDGDFRWLTLFAHDAAVRRTALASAIGLIVTASVFFKAPRVEAPVIPVRVRKTPRKPAPPQRIVGA